MKKDTSWNSASGWYENMIDEEGSYQKEVILPNLERLISFKAGMKILDLGCGTGFFSRAFKKNKSIVTGIDNSADMIAAARSADPNGAYICADAGKLVTIKNSSFDAVTIILALQNMNNLSAVTKECNRVLVLGGSLYIVLNHPCFRIPKESFWEWNAEKTTQFRRVDRYLSESKNTILMHPGIDAGEKTVSFHRPMQSYFKALSKAGFAVTSLEEWISHRVGPKGKTFAALEQSRKEIPIFLFLGARKLL